MIKNLFQTYFDRSFKTFADWQIFSISQNMASAMVLALSSSDDYFNTLKAYKSSHERHRDYLQPIYGIFNLLRGLASFIVIPFMMASDLIFGTVSLFMKRFDSDIDNIKNYFTKFLAFIFLFPITFGISILTRAIEASAALVRGLSQLVTTPLTWLLRIPLRNLLTALWGSPKIEENSELKPLLHKLQDNDLCSTSTYLEIHRYFREQRELGQKTALVNENSIYERIWTRAEALAAQVSRENRERAPGALVDYGPEAIRLAELVDEAKLEYHHLFAQAPQAALPPVYHAAAVPPPAF